MLEDDFSVALLEDDQREFEAGMVVSTTKSGRKINCCEQLLKQCLELIDRYGLVDHVHKVSKNSQHFYHRTVNMEHKQSKVEFPYSRYKSQGSNGG